MSLTELAQRYNTDKFEHEYCGYYEKHLPNATEMGHGILFEIGIATGASLRMWRDYYPNAFIVGIDNNPDVSDIPQDGFHIIFGDATREEDIKSNISTAEIIIDDGSHMAKDVLSSFEILWPMLKSGGWYIIEDLGCIFTEGFGGDEKGGIVADKLHGLLELALRGNIAEFHAYLEIVFLKKL